MGLAERRRALGYSQERLAQAVGVDRTTVGRWESGRITPQPAQRRRLATTLDLSLRELDVLLSPPRAGQGAAGRQVDAVPSAGDLDEMIRREFLRLLTVSGALAALSDDEAQALTSEFLQAAPSDFTQMNAHLWQVYRLARTKATLRPVIRDQLAALGRAASGSHPRPLLHAAADLLQLAGEVAFDANRHTEAAASYALAASAGKDTRAYDLWACALVRHAYVDMAEHRNRQAVQLLDMARKLAERGDTALPTRHWAASVKPRRMPASAISRRASGRWTTRSRSGSFHPAAPTVAGSDSTVRDSRRNAGRVTYGWGGWTWRRRRWARRCGRQPWHRSGPSAEGAPCSRTWRPSVCGGAIRSRPWRTAGRPSNWPKPRLPDTSHVDSRSCATSWLPWAGTRAWRS